MQLPGFIWKNQKRNPSALNNYFPWHQNRAILVHRKWWHQCELMGIILKKFFLLSQFGWIFRVYQLNGCGNLKVRALASVYPTGRCHNCGMQNATIVALFFWKVCCWYYIDPIQFLRIFSKTIRKSEMKRNMNKYIKINYFTFSLFNNIY